MLDAADRAGLRRELESHGLQVSPHQPAEPLQVPLNGRSAQEIIALVKVELSRFQIAEPTLEDAYLRLLERAAHERAGSRRGLPAGDGRLPAGTSTRGTPSRAPGHWPYTWPAAGPRGSSGGGHGCWTGWGRPTPEPAPPAPGPPGRE